MAADYRRIARVAKAHGTKGEVVTVPVDGLPPLLSEGLRVAVVPPALKGSRWHEVRDVRSSDAGQLVRLSGVSDLGAARELAGKWLLAAEGDLPEDFAWMDLADIVGREVIDDRLGSLGTVEEVMVGPANDVWVVRGERGETLVPAVPDIVIDLPDEGAIRTSVPVGLVPGDTGSEAFEEE